MNIEHTFLLHIFTSFFAKKRAEKR